MTQEHPITPSPELVHQWAGYAKGYNIPGTVIEYIATQAARWGADQELKACCEWLLDHGYDLCSPEMRKDRRPKPPSLKEQASEELRKISISPELGVSVQALDTIRRALESLPD